MQNSLQQSFSKRLPSGTTNNYLFALILLFLCCGCSMHPAAKKKVGALNDTLTQYNVALRWEGYRFAYAFHRNRDGDPPTLDADSFEAISITGITLLDVLLSRTEEQAIVAIEINYYQNDSGLVKRVTLEHNWWYDQPSKRWFNASAFPELK